jgi:hypothetical protein
MVGDMIPRFHERCTWRFLLYASGTFLGGFFCDLTCSMLENMSYGRIITAEKWISGTDNLVVTRTAIWRSLLRCAKNAWVKVGVGSFGVS